MSDNPCGLDGTSFLDACNKHDKGYSTCNANKATVDSQFRQDMMDACEGAGDCGEEGDGILDVDLNPLDCETYAQRYADAVVAAGGSAFDGGQYDGCLCCD